MSDFKPIPSQTGYGRFQHFCSYRDFLPPQTQEQPQAGPSSSVPPPAHVPSDPAPQDEAERPSSPDPFDFLGQQESEQDALIADALQALSAEQSDCFTLPEAVEFAFKQRNATPLRA